MKNLIFGLLAASGATAFGQISINDSDFPSGGDTALVSISTNFDLDYASSGPDYVWDFSVLEMTEQRIDTFFDIEDASITYQVVFNNGWFDPDYQADYYTPFLNFVMPESEVFEFPISNPVSFTKVESDKVENVGVGLEIGGIQVPVKNEIIDIQYELPMNYDDGWMSNSFFEIDLNPAFDGILRRYQERTTQVDGWGELTTPYGTFDVLRTFATIEYTDSLKVIFGETETWVELPTPTQIIYSWWTSDQKIPVLEVVAQEVFDAVTVTSVEYKDHWLGDLSIKDFEQSHVVVYPNPSSENIFISGVNQIEAIQMLDFTGKVIENVSWDAQNQLIDIRDMAAGTYILRVKTGSDVISKQIIVQ